LDLPRAEELRKARLDRELANELAAGKTRSRLVRRAKMLSWLSLVWMTIEGAQNMLCAYMASGVLIVRVRVLGSS
jgi:glutamate synthase domain-containing protein 3